MLEELSRWLREGPIAHRVPWRWRGPLERLTVEHAYRNVAGPLHWSVADGRSEVELLFGGDLSLHRWRPGEDPAARFGGLGPGAGAARGLFLNLESQFTTRDTPAGRIGSSLRADPSALGVLTFLGVTAVSCANNHCLDFGAGGLQESIERLESAGIAAIGVTGPGRDGGRVVEVQGVRLGLLAFTDDWRVNEESGPAVAPLPHDPALVRERIGTMQRLADLVIVQVHWGYEWSMYPLRTQRDLARQYADAGAALVLCHHAHVPMGVERRGGGIIAHGLGNFHFGPAGEEAHPFRRASLLLRVGVNRTGVVEALAVPIGTDLTGRTEIATGSAARVITRSLARLSARLDDDGYLDRVERSLLLQQGCDVLLDLARRLADGDARGAAERVRYLDPPRQRLLVPSLAGYGGLPGKVAVCLLRAREAGGSLGGTPLADEILALRAPVRRYLAARRQKGRIP